MTITLPIGPIATFVIAHPWPTVVLAFLIGVVLPAIWSTRPHRRRAAMAMIRTILETAMAITAAIGGGHRP
ncbi:MAG: hypothetical protein ACRDRO_23860 [Pseudonocardiaceae bacterium]